MSATAPKPTHPEGIIEQHISEHPELRAASKYAANDWAPDERMLRAAAEPEVSAVPPAQGADEPGTAMLGGCTCYGKAPTVPVYRSRETHLDDCPAKATSYPVGVCITNATREQQDWIEGARVLREQTHVEAERWRAKGTPERSITTFGGAMKAQAAKLEHFVIHGRVRDE